MKGIAKYTGKVCPKIQDKLEKLKHKSIPFSATSSGRFMYGLIMVVRDMWLTWLGKHAVVGFEI